MDFCDRTTDENGDIVVLKMRSDDGKQHLTEEAITGLIGILEGVKKDAKNFKGLITTSVSGSFCEGFNFDSSSPEAKEKVYNLMATVLQLLFELPMPTVAAVGGKATSLGLLLALAHDHCIVWKHAELALPEAKLGYLMPSYGAALLRDKVALALPRKLLMLKSQVCTGLDLSRKWTSAHSSSDDRDGVLDDAFDLLQEIAIKKEVNYAKMRQTMYAQTTLAVDAKALPSEDEISYDDPVENYYGSSAHRVPGC